MGSTDRQGGVPRAEQSAAGRPGALGAAPGGAASTAWMDHAACRGVSSEEFFDTAGQGARWCRHCPVIECCFWWAALAESEVGYRFGIWGGATPATRGRVAAVVGTGVARARLGDATRQWAQRAQLEAGSREVEERAG